MSISLLHNKTKISGIYWKLTNPRLSVTLQDGQSCPSVELFILVQSDITSVIQSQRHESLVTGVRSDVGIRINKLPLSRIPSSKIYSVGTLINFVQLFSMCKTASYLFISVMLETSQQISIITYLIHLILHRLVAAMCTTCFNNK